LLDHHDSGYFNLPDAALAARAAVVRMEAFVAGVAEPDIDAARENLTDGLADAARTGGKWPTAAAVAKTTAAKHEATELRQSASEALDKLANALAATLSDEHGIVTRCLRPAHDAAVAEARSAVEEITTAGADPLDVLQATAVAVRKDLQEPREALGHAGQVYFATVDARYRLVTAVGGQQRDGNGEFAWCRNLAQLWPGHGYHGAVPPWPTDDSSALFLWRLAAADLWMPTRDEADEAWDAAHADGLARAANARRAGVGGVFVGR